MGNLTSQLPGSEQRRKSALSERGQGPLAGSPLRHPPGYPIPLNALNTKVTPTVEFVT
jgi:hypothetical protein